MKLCIEYYKANRDLNPLFSESGRNSKRTKLRTDMIGAPEKDFRHTGHIGYDGAVFGDVSFIGDNIDKLPAKGE